MLIAFVIFYLALNLGVGWWASKKVHSTQDFVLAGRSLPFALATMVTFATWFGSETILGAPKEFVHGGVLAIIEEPFGAALGLFLVGAIYARKLYPLPVLTFSDYFRLRFGAFSEKLSAHHDTLLFRLDFRTISGFGTYHASIITYFGGDGNHHWSTFSDGLYSIGWDVVDFGDGLFS